jgi:hypothetical protein
MSPHFADLIEKQRSGVGELETVKKVDELARSKRKSKRGRGAQALEGIQYAVIENYRQAMLRRYDRKDDVRYVVFY